MVLAAGDGKSLHILSPDSGAEPGMKISWLLRLFPFYFVRL
jgi:hypothetical protein